MAQRNGSGSGGRTRGDNTTAAAAAGGNRELRIVGGRWRGRRWRFPAGTTIRPTPDRVRETLFNWLMPTIVGARCLDLFAGSGALGLEALSRGAASLVAVERERASAEALRMRIDEWSVDAPVDAQVLECDALRWLESAVATPFDLVFLDPPFSEGLLPRACAALETRGWFSPTALIYVEQPAASALPAVAGWRAHRSGRAGDVGYHLLQRGATIPPSQNGGAST